MKQKVVLIIFFLLVIISGVLITQVEVNYDLEKYLPKDSEIKESINIYKDNFGDSSYAYIAIDEENVSKAINVKEKIELIEGVKQVLFVDDYLNELTYSIIRSYMPVETQSILDNTLASLLATGITYPEALYQLANYLPETQKEELQNQFTDSVSDSHMLFQVVFSTSSADLKTEESVDSVKILLDEENYDYKMKGDAISTAFTKNTIAKETTLITLIIIPLIIAILIIMSKSFFDIILFGIVAGSAIIINLGTNAFLPDISYITQSMAIALQLAISLDYIIFTINSYHGFREQGIEVAESVVLATKKSRRPVIASALTTGVSFLALAIMKFQIGLDIGIVFSKAILISLFTTLFLLPVLIRLFAGLIGKTKKKSKITDFTWFAKFGEKCSKYRYYFLGFLLIIITPLIYLQTQNEFTFGVNSFSASEGTAYYEDSNWIDENFGQKNNYIILVEKNNSLEAALYQKLINLDYVYNVDAGVYYKSVITDPLVLSSVIGSFYSDDYALFQVTVMSDVESETTFAQYEEMLNIVETTGFTENHIIGETAVSYHIKDIIVRDFTWVLVVAIIAIMIIIFFSFKNLLIPILLIVVIEVAVFLSMSIINVFDQDLVFLAYLIVSTILLGATIDYAILFTKRYMEERLEKGKTESIMKASIDATPSIVTSALLFIIAGLTIAMISSINSIAQIGLLIAVGAFVSMIFVLIILPQMLYIFDKFIIKSGL
ncbi:MAG: MMPL family transporter [Candidatus Izemoplasmatales bacterium]